MEKIMSYEEFKEWKVSPLTQAIIDIVYQKMHERLYEIRKGQFYAHTAIERGMEATEIHGFCQAMDWAFGGGIEEEVWPKEVERDQAQLEQATGG